MSCWVALRLLSNSEAGYSTTSRKRTDHECNCHRLRIAPWLCMKHCNVSFDWRETRVKIVIDEPVKKLLWKLITSEINKLMSHPNNSRVQDECCRNKFLSSERSNWNQTETNAKYDRRVQEWRHQQIVASWCDWRLFQGDTKMSTAPVLASTDKCAHSSEAQNRDADVIPGWNISIFPLHMAVKNLS